MSKILISNYHVAFNVTCIRVTRTHIGFVSNTFRDLQRKPFADRYHLKFQLNKTMRQDFKQHVLTKNSIKKASVIARETLITLTLSHKHPKYIPNKNIYQILTDIFVLASCEQIIYPAIAATTSHDNTPTVPSPRPLILRATAMATALFLKT